MATATRIVTTAGTTLAHDGVVPEAQRPASDVWRGRRNLYFIQEAQHVSRFAMAMGAVVHAALIGILLLSDYPLWRVLAIAGGFCIFGATQLVFISKATREERCI